MQRCAQTSGAESAHWEHTCVTAMRIKRQALPALQKAPPCPLTPKISAVW